MRFSLIFLFDCIDVFAQRVDSISKFRVANIKFIALHNGALNNTVNVDIDWFKM